MLVMEVGQMGRIYSVFIERSYFVLVMFLINMLVGASKANSF